MSVTVIFKVRKHTKKHRKGIIYVVCRELKYIRAFPARVKKTIDPISYLLIDNKLRNFTVADLLFAQKYFLLITDRSLRQIKQGSP